MNSSGMKIATTCTCSAGQCNLAGHPLVEDGVRRLSMPDPPGTTRLAEIRRRLHAGKRLVVVRDDGGAEQGRFEIDASREAEARETVESGLPEGWSYDICSFEADDD